MDNTTYWYKEIEWLVIEFDTELSRFMNKMFLQKITDKNTCCKYKCMCTMKRKTSNKIVISPQKWKKNVIIHNTNYNFFQFRQWDN